MPTLPLEHRRSDTTPKCCRCSWWQGGNGYAGHCDLVGMKTLDLEVCSAFKAQVQTGEVMEDGD
jgi:hypothetical protein